jgi:hypothetical protein
MSDMDKTVLEGLMYAQDMISKATGIEVMMAAMMLDNVILSLTEGRGPHDKLRYLGNDNARS